MWTAPPSKTLAVDRMSRRNKNAPSPTSPTSPLVAPSPTSLLAQYHTQNLTDLLEPAVDGPPSPESIRALSQQMRRTSAKDKHQSRQTTSSSGSSSLLSLASLERPSWENAFEGPGLSRRSSGGSTASSMQPRERSDSVQIFGKSLFNRRGKLRRESSVQSSAASSLHSADMPSDTSALPPPPPPPPPTSSGTIIPSLFGRKKSLGSDSLTDAETRRPLQISAPYNFQHLTHTQKENLPNLQLASKTALQSGFSAIRASQMPSHGALKGIQANDLHFSDFSTDALPLGDAATDSATSSRISLAQALPSPKQQASPSRQESPPHGSRSQDQIRIPPRPPRHPDDGIFAAPPMPPPRVSSRISVRGDGMDALTGVLFDRPQTSSGFVETGRLRPSGDEEDGEEEEGLHMRLNVRGREHVVPQEYRYSRVIMTTPDDTNWPLVSALNSPFDVALPDVPEEEEHTMTARSRVSIASSTSLRGSQSVPALRRLTSSQSQTTTSTTHQRRPSNSSDTLGQFDLIAAQQALRDALGEGTDGNGAEFLPRESWEDDIDYCYEHEAEANCEYAWDRPSFDESREEENATPVDVAVRNSQSEACDSPSMLNPGRLDLPGLSPVSHVSASTSLEAISPTGSTGPVTSGFSLPRADGKHPEKPLHIRKSSYASTFKESHGFNLSPSLLIPNSDYHQEMMLAEAEWYPGQDEVPYIPYEEPVLTMDTSTLLIQPRISASTVASTDSERMGSDRHISTASNSTGLTRLTLSTTSLDIEGLIAENKCVQDLPISSASSASGTTLKKSDSITRTRGQSEPLKLPPRFEDFGETTLGQRNFSHIMPSSPKKTKDDSPVKLVKQLKEPVAALTRRPRAKTTSLATPNASSQYGLYPAVNMAFSRM